MRKLKGCVFVTADWFPTALSQSRCPVSGTLIIQTMLRHQQLADVGELDPLPLATLHTTIRVRDVALNSLAL